MIMFSYLNNKKITLGLAPTKASRIRSVEKKLTPPSMERGLCAKPHWCWSLVHHTGFRLRYLGVGPGIS